jgi:hypothetical protein
MKIFIQNRMAVASTKEVHTILTWRNQDWSLYQVDQCQTIPRFLHLIGFYTIHKCFYVTIFTFCVCILQKVYDDYLKV